MKRRKILIVSPELTPYASTGGLAEVSAALLKYLHGRGHDVCALIPFYRSVKESAPGEVVSPLCVHTGAGEQWCAIRIIQGGGAALYAVEHDLYFDRSGLYHDPQMNDYMDNPRRFAFLSLAALQFCSERGFTPDIVHVHDWQTSLIPAYIKRWFWNHPNLGRSASVLTIHNIAYQGVYPADHWPYIGLDGGCFNEQAFAAAGQVNFLKGGIFFADAISTVSHGYREEILTGLNGCGLSPFLHAKADRFVGILNGVDYRLWSPESDALIPNRYSRENLAGKARCKQELQAAFHLENDGRVCLIGTIGRMVEQKGFHIVRQIIEEVLQHMAVQFVILGSGDPALEHYFRTLPEKFPGRAGSYMGYSNPLAHLIEAGADLFLMPSLFEPCGLNQLYSLKYGTPPIVHAVGGLDDSIEQYNEQTGEGTGFKFYQASPSALYYTIGWAVSTYYDRPRHMEMLRDKGMREDHSWERAIQHYEDLYEAAGRAKKAYDRSHLG